MFTELAIAEIDKINELLLFDHFELKEIEGGYIVADKYNELLFDEPFPIDRLYFMLRGFALGLKF